MSVLPHRMGVARAVVVLLFAVGLYWLPAPALAATEALLQFNAEGRAGANRHRLILTDTAADGRDVMLVLSCRVEDSRTFGVALDVGAGPIWNIDGEDVALLREGQEVERRRMDVRGEYLTLGGPAGREAIAPLLQSGRIGFGVGTRDAAFDLGAVRAHVDRWRELCPG